MARNPILRRSSVLLTGVMIAGTAGIHGIEAWSVWHSFFFTLITPTTVGYTEYGLSEAGERIAQGSGSEQPAVGQLIKQFDAINTMAKQMAAGGMPGMGLPMMETKGSTKAQKSGVKRRKKRR